MTSFTYRHEHAHISSPISNLKIIDSYIPLSSNFQALRFRPFLVQYLEQGKKGMKYKASAGSKCKEMTI